ncbi:hypothetical protein VNO80_18918 [Phaseolus coccineus]|uniref:Uncharacterized protein n=1 Tax=Phaseolus coccineus TaxID=3886 RepID=A0AAN9MG92_PHACN
MEYLPQFTSQSIDILLLLMCTVMNAYLSWTAIVYCVLSHLSLVVLGNISSCAWKLESLAERINCTSFLAPSQKFILETLCTSHAPIYPSFHSFSHQRHTTLQSEEHSRSSCLLNRNVDARNQALALGLVYFYLQILITTE